MISPAMYARSHTWFMPALAKSRVGSSWGTTGLDFQNVWSCFSVKNEMKDSRTRDAGQPLSENSDIPVTRKDRVIRREKGTAVQQ